MKTGDIYRGWTIEDRADGWYGTLREDIWYGPFETEDQLMVKIDKHIKLARQVAADRTGRYDC